MYWTNYRLFKLLMNFLHGTILSGGMEDGVFVLTNPSETVEVRVAIFGDHSEYMACSVSCDDQEYACLIKDKEDIEEIQGRVSAYLA